LRAVETDVLVIGAGAAGSMAAIKASEFTDKVLVLEKAVLRSCGNLAMGHHSGELNQMTNIPGGPTSEQFVEGYLSSSSGWSCVKRPLDKYIVAEEFPSIVKDLETWGLEIYKKSDGGYASYWERFIGERMESGVEIKGGTMKKCLVAELGRRNIEVVERTMGVDLLTHGNRVT
jgi:succinate dehydrogenase/fumarate reductase flavoprotein subunit